MKNPFEECPSFNSCGCNRCPLDLNMLEMPALEGEEKCKASRATRLAIVERYPVKFPTGGLKESEISRDKRSAAAKVRWNALPDDVRASHLARLKPRKRGVEAVLSTENKNETSG